MIKLVQFQKNCFSFFSHGSFKKNPAIKILRKSLYVIFLLTKNSRCKVKRSTCTKCWTSCIFVFYLGTYIVDENLSSQHAISYNLLWIYEYTVTVTVVTNSVTQSWINMINTFFSLIFFFLYMTVLWDTRKLSTQSSSIFIKHVTVFYKSPTSEWRLRVENQSINVFPLPLVFFYLYHLFFKILNSTDPHSFLSLQQSSSNAGRDPEQNIELKKKVLNFFNVLTLSGSRFQHPDPDQDPN